MTPASTPAAPRPTIARIQRAVAEYYGVSLDRMAGIERDARVIKARHLAMYLARIFCRCSYRQIGDACGGRDPTTVMHAVHKIRRAAEDDPELFEDIAALRGVLR